MYFVVVALGGLHNPRQHHIAGHIDRIAVRIQEERWGCTDRTEAVGRVWEAVVAARAVSVPHFLVSVVARAHQGAVCAVAVAVAVAVVVVIANCPTDVGAQEQLGVIVVVPVNRTHPQFVGVAKAFAQW